MDKESALALCRAVSKSKIQKLILDETKYSFSISLSLTSSIDTSLIPSFVSLGNCRTLSSLSFHDCLLDTEGLRQLLIILRRCPAITSLDLGNNCIDASALPLLADFLGTLPSLRYHSLDDVLTVRSIDITGVGMSPQQASLFAQLAASADCDIAVTVDPS